MRRSRWIGLWIASALAGMVGWHRLAEPTWTLAGTGSGVSFTPLAFVSEDRLLAIRRRDASSSILVHVELSTGRIIRELVLQAPVCGTAHVLNDGETVALIGGNNGQSVYHFFSGRDGTTRYPSFPVRMNTQAPNSPDGRYLLAWPTSKADQRQWMVDLHSGTALYPIVGFNPQFAPDGQRWAAIEWQNKQEWVVFHRLSDGGELGRTPIARFGGGKSNRLTAWKGDRLHLRQQSPTQPPVRRSNDVNNSWSFRVTETELSDPRPDQYPRVRSSSLLGTTIMQSEDWEGEVLARTRIRTTHVTLHNLKSALKLLIRMPASLNTFRVSKQFERISEENGATLSHPIEYGGWFTSVVVSPQGEWVAAPGSTLKIWKLSPDRRVPNALGAALVPWGLLWLGWLLRKGVAAFARTRAVRILASAATPSDGCPQIPDLTTPVPWGDAMGTGLSEPQIAGQTPAPRPPSSSASTT